MNCPHCKEEMDFEEEILPCPKCTDGNLELQESKFHNGQGEPEKKVLKCNMCEYRKEVL